MKISGIIPKKIKWLYEHLQETKNCTEQQDIPMTSYGHCELKRESIMFFSASQLQRNDLPQKNHCQTVNYMLQNFVAILW